MDPFNWTCPYCGTATTIVSDHHWVSQADIASRSKFLAPKLRVESISCPSPDCKGLFISASLHRFGLPTGKTEGHYALREKYAEWQLMPRSRSKPQPEYIPEEIRSNYLEACLILKDSPKASAAMSRRCLQGLARDFWQIPMNRRGNLGAELSFVKDQVAPDTWDAIQAIRSIGDIGAHMEKDVNLIIEVEPHEAELLIELIETLFEDWYVDRHKRQVRAAAVKTIAAEKLNAKKAGIKAPLAPEGGEP